MDQRCFRELSRIQSFDERFEYLALKGIVGQATFGYDRWMNQDFYASREWRNVRHEVIARDNGCDLGIPGYEIHDKIYIHHMNPMTSAEIEHGDDSILDPEFLITTTHRTHNAIHYGDKGQLPRLFVERRPGDTKLW